MADALPARKQSAPLNRACEPCRQSKVRCLPGVSEPSPICQRCLKYDRACIFAAQRRKKPRKRTDARVAELEMEILAMRKLLGQSRQAASIAPVRSPPPSTPSREQSSESATKDRQPVSRTESQPKATMSIEDLITSMAEPTLREARYDDPVSQGLVTLESARNIFSVFRKHLLPHFPVLAITDDSMFDDYRTDKPLLLHAILASGSSKAAPELYSILSTSLIQEYSRRIMLLGQKSLELVQAMMVSSSWYFSADHWRNQRFYEYLNLASTVALDIGLGEPYQPTDTMLPSVRGFYLGGSGTVALELQDTDNFIDRKRALIGCYNACQSVTMSLRRSNMMNFTMYMVECAKGLEASPSRNDNCLAAWARLMNMADEISVAYGLTDQSKRASLADERIQQIMLSFIKRIQAWHAKYANKGYSASLFIMYHFITAFIYEPALYDYYPPGTFKAPYDLTLSIVLQSDLSNLPPQPTEALCRLALTAQDMIDIFSTQDMDFVRSLANHLLVRINYSCVVLLRIALLDMLLMKPSHPARLNTAYQDLAKVDLYIGKAIDHMVEASGMLEYRNPSLFVARLIKIRKWYKYQQQKWQSGMPLDESHFTMFAGPDTHPCLDSSPGGEMVDDVSPEESQWDTALDVDTSFQEQQQSLNYSLPTDDTFTNTVTMEGDWNNEPWGADLIEADFLDLANQFSGLDDPNTDFDMSTFVPMQGAFDPPHLSDGLSSFGFQNLH